MGCKKYVISKEKQNIVKTLNDGNTASEIVEQFKSSKNQEGENIGKQKKNDFKNIEKSVNKIKRALNKRKLIDQQEHI